MVHWTGQARPIDGILMTEVTVGREKLEVSHGANSTSARPSSLPVHSPSPPEEEFTIRVSGMPGSMQGKPGPKLIRLASPAT